MARSTVLGRIVKWGRAKGIWLPPKEAARLHIPVGTDVTLTVEPVDERLDPRDMMVVQGSPTDSLDHDRSAAEGRSRRRRR